MNPRSAPRLPLHADLLALLASCRSAPADDTPRLVLADWLDEHADLSGLPGDDARARAALIRVQVELARPTCDAAHLEELRAAEQRLLQLHAERWLGDLPGRLHEIAHPAFGFGRGFDASPPQPFAFAPLRHANPWRFARGLLAVSLSPGDLSDAELGAWFGSPLAAWTEVASVDLGGPTGLERLAVADALRPYLGVHYTVGAPEFPTLQQVRVRNQNTTERQCRRLLKSANFGLVRGLTLFGPALEAGFLRLMTRADVSRVQRLAIKAPVSDTDAAFLGSANLVALSALDVPGTELTPAGMGSIAHSPHLGQLVSLVAFRNGLGDDGLAALAGAPLANTLRVLEVQNTGAGDRGVAALVGSPLLGRLHGPGLNLSMNPLGDAAAAALAAGGHLARFTELILRDCAVGDAGAAALAASPHVANLTYLDLWKNRIGDPGARALAASPHLDGVRDLSLRDNTVTAAGARALRARFGDRVKV